MSPLSGLLEYERTNAALGWLVVGGLLVIAVERAASGDPLWSGLAVAVVAVAVVPPLSARNPTEMVAWEVLALAAVPIAGAYLVEFDGQLSFVAVATLALIIAVELDALTDVHMTPDVAVVFVVIVTMAVAALWSLGRFAADALLGTAYLSTNDALMWDLIGATAVGIAAGLVFELYVRRVSPGHALARETWGESR